MKRWLIVGTTGLLLIIGSWLWPRRGGAGDLDRLLLLVPDETSFSDPKVAMWTDAGNELGLHVVPIHDSEFVRPFFGQPDCAGLIFPDSIHQSAGDPLIAAVRRFVLAGGHMMLVYDAGTLNANGKYVQGWSRLSDLAGVDYALYDQLHDSTIQWASIVGNNETVRQMEIPPGKYFPFQATDSNGNFDVELRRYKFGELDYPSFTTSSNISGNVLLHSKAGVVAMRHDFGKGSVLFVNLPLGYLKANTDGLPLHTFLRYFAVHVLDLPYMLSVPDGIGGLVLNWHVDSNAA